MSNKINIGLFGLGCVGRGVYNNIEKFYADQINIKKICIKNLEKHTDIDPQLLTTKASDIFDDSSIDLVIELIDNGAEATALIAQSLRSGKDVISANKAAIANSLRFFIDLQNQTGNTLLYEGAVAGAVPVIRLLESHYANEKITGIEGIVNGSTNYLLSKLRLDKLTFEDALAQAQSNGFAESDPSLDIDGWDAGYKLIILAAHAFGDTLSIEEVQRTTFSEFLAQAPDLSKPWKCVAKVTHENENIELSIDFKEEPADSQFTTVEYELNAIKVHSAIAGTNVLYGSGAGANATASAVLSDLFQWKKGFRYDYSKFYQRKAYLKKLREVVA